MSSTITIVPLGTTLAMEPGMNTGMSTAMNAESLVVLGFLLAVAAILLAWALFRLVTFTVGEGEAVLVTRFGKLTDTLTTPGLRVMPAKMMPWVHLKRMSLRRDFRDIDRIAVNDRNGTSIVVDAWLELRVADPARAVFAVDNWDRAVRDLVTHVVTSIVADTTLEEVLRDRSSIGDRLSREIAAETARWGVVVEKAFVRRISLSRDVQDQLLRSVAARLFKQKADIEESGRLRVERLLADTRADTATLEARAKAQYPAAVGRALERLGKTPAVLQAYEALYELSQLRPHRTTAFRGFKAGEMRAADAAMLQPLEVPRLGPGHGDAE